MVIDLGFGLSGIGDVFLNRQEENLQLLRGEALSYRQQVWMVICLSNPAILAEISSIVMQYIDAAMVGSLGKDATASIGLIGQSMGL